MFSFISIDSTEIQNDKNNTVSEFDFNVNTNQITVKDGQICTVSGKDAIKVWIYKCLRTERGRYDAYDWDYGVDLPSLYTSGLSREAMKSEAQRMIVEALEQNPHIISVTNFRIDFSKDKMTASFLVNTDQNDSIKISY